MLSTPPGDVQVAVFGADHGDDASMTAFKPLPQTLLTLTPPTLSGKPAPMLTCRGSA